MMSHEQAKSVVSDHESLPPTWAAHFVLFSCWKFLARGRLGLPGGVAARNPRHHVILSRAAFDSFNSLLDGFRIESSQKPGHV